MKYILLFLLSFSAFGALTEEERATLRKMSMTFCSCRNNTHTIYFDTEKKLAKAFCWNNESKVFLITDTYDKCEK